MSTGYFEYFIEKEIEESLKKMENSPINSDKFQIERIVKLFLRYDRGNGKKIRIMPKI